MAGENGARKYLLAAKKLLRRATPEWVLLTYHLLFAVFAIIWYGHPSRKIIVIGITGTKGKTTATLLTHSVLSATGVKVGALSTIEARIGEKVYPNTKHMTMAGRGFVQKMLREMVKKGCSYAVIEVPSEGIRQFRTLGVKYDAVVFTNLSPEHLVTHKTFDRYRETKGRLFRGFARSKQKVLGGSLVRRLVLLNADDENADYFRDVSQAPDAEQILFGFDKKATTKIKRDENSEKNEFSIEGDSYTVPSPGVISIYNAIPAIILAKRYCNADHNTIKTALMSIPALSGRMERIDVGQEFAVFCDYAHEPLSIKQVHEALKGYAAPNGRVIMLVGAIGGSRWKYNAKDIGEVATKLADLTIFTIIDPYNDDPKEMLNALTEGAKRNKDTQWVVEPDRREAIHRALREARQGDVVIITGKGNEVTMEMPGGSIPWNEREIVREEIQKLTDN